MKPAFYLLSFLWLIGPHVFATPPQVAKSSSKPLKIEEELIAFWDDLREHNSSFRKQFASLTQQQRIRYGARFDASSLRIPKIVPWWPLRRVYGISFLLGEEGVYLMVLPVGKGGEMNEFFDVGLVAQFHVRYHAVSKLRSTAEGSDIHDELISNNLELTFDGFQKLTLKPATLR